MTEVFDEVARVVSVIRENEDLRLCFVRLLAMGAATQQVRVAALLKEVQTRRAPNEVVQFVKLLSNEKLATRVLTELERG